MHSLRLSFGNTISDRRVKKMEDQNLGVRICHNQEHGIDDQRNRAIEIAQNLTQVRFWSYLT